jgi:AraC-like DNA-binding protein
MLTPQGQIETCDADAVVAALSRILAPHEMEVGQAGRTIRARVRHVQLSACRLADLTYGVPVRIRSRVPADRVLIHAVAEGESRMTLPGGRVLALEAQSMHVSLPGAPLDIAFAGNSRHLTANLPVALWPVGPGGGVYGGRVALEPGRGALWLDLMRLALGWAEMGGAQVPSGHLVALIGDFLRDQAFDGEEPAGPAPWFLVQARAVMADLVRRGEEAITLGLVAQRVGVGVRTLQAGFRRFAGCTFGEELREQRLNEFDRRLLASGDGGRHLADAWLRHYQYRAFRGLLSGSFRHVAIGAVKG